MTPRFRKLPGGAIIDSLSGRAVAHVCVTQLDTATADRVSDAIITALHEAYDPRQPEDIPECR